MLSVSKVFDPERIKKQNEAFHRLPKKQQRIAIAKDVIKQIKLEKYQATQGEYLRSYKLEDLVFEGGYDNPMDLQEALIKGAPECYVCGLGCSFLFHGPFGR